MSSLYDPINNLTANYMDFFTRQDSKFLDAPSALRKVLHPFPFYLPSASFPFKLFSLFFSFIPLHFLHHFTHSFNRLKSSEMATPQSLLSSHWDLESLSINSPLISLKNSTLKSLAISVCSIAKDSNYTMTTFLSSRTKNISTLLLVFY